MDECINCAAAAKSEKKIKLELLKSAAIYKGTMEAQGNGLDGFYLALAKNENDYIARIERPEQSSLSWEYISIM